ncbi:MAG: methionyl-tRNA formyltransferase [Alphaproteobacteria bacterium]|nr:methionyl-tRNA formyltransferase [Alphaproteobacteria bacterium]
MTLKPHRRLIAMGTPYFMQYALERLLEAKDENGEYLFDLVAIYTRAPKPNGRGMGLVYSPVHKAALELQKNYRLPFEIVTPETFKDPEAVKKFQSFEPDLVLVGAYGLKLTKPILDTPSMGCINLHASLLPKYRGASPIQRAILNGEKETGLTIMNMAEGMDTGDILAQKVLKLEPTMTTQDVCTALSKMAPDLLMKVLLENPKGEKQDESKATYADKITKQEAQIDWSKSPKIISCQIRAFSPVPGAFTFIENDKGHYLRLKIYNVLPSDQKAKSSEHGVILQNDGKLVVGCGNGALEITDLQLEGKKRMTGEEFIHGNILTKGTKLLNAALVLQQMSAEGKKKIIKEDSPTFWRIVSLLIPRHGRPQKAAADSQPRPMKIQDR